MIVISPFKEVRLGIQQMAEESPAKAYAALARRNIINSGLSLATADLAATLSVGEVGRNILTSGFIGELQHGQPQALEAVRQPVLYMMDTFSHDGLALGLAAVSAVSAALVIPFFASTFIRGGQSINAAIRHPKAR